MVQSFDLNQNNVIRKSVVDLLNGLSKKLDNGAIENWKYIDFSKGDIGEYTKWFLHENRYLGYVEEKWLQKF